MEILAVVLAGWGAFLLLAGPFGAVWTRRFLRTAVAVEGTVVGHEKKAETGADGGPMTHYYPVVEYEDAAGGSTV